MDITYTHGEKTWRFAAVPHDPAVDLDVARLCRVPNGQTGAAQTVARRVLADYIQMTDDQKIIDTGNDDPLAQFVARAIWVVMAPVEPLPVTARWTVPELGAQELFIPCGFLPQDENLYTVDEWALEALMSDNVSERWSAAYISTSERVHLFAIKDAEWYIRQVAALKSTSKRVHLLALQDEHWEVRYSAAEKSISEEVHLVALQDKIWLVRRIAAEASTSERIHLVALQDGIIHIRIAAAKKTTSKKALDIAMQDRQIAVLQAAKNNPAFKKKIKPRHLHIVQGCT